MTQAKEFYCPIDSKVNPNILSAQHRLEQWIQEFGLITDTKTLNNFIAAKFGYLAAYTYPNAAPAELQVIADLLGWLFVMDDQCDENVIGTNPEQLNTLFDEFLAILRFEDVAAINLDNNRQLKLALINLWQRILSAAPALEEWSSRFIKDVEDCFRACVWEATNRAAGLKPSVALFIQQRLLTSAVYPVFDLTEMTDKIYLPPEVLSHPILQKLSELAGNVVCWSNDVLSVHKELAHGDVHNLVIVLQQEESLSLEQAIERAIEMHNQAVVEFFSLEKQLPIFDKYIDRQLLVYVIGLRAWMRGNLDWATLSGRYQPIDSNNNLCKSA